MEKQPPEIPADETTSDSDNERGFTPAYDLEPGDVFERNSFYDD